MGKIHIDEIDKFTDEIPDGYCYLCGKEKWRWDTEKHEHYCPQCYNKVVDGLIVMARGCNESELWDAIDDLWDDAFERSR